MSFSASGKQVGEKPHDQMTRDSIEARRQEAIQKLREDGVEVSDLADHVDIIRYKMGIPIPAHKAEINKAREQGQ